MSCVKETRSREVFSSAVVHWLDQENSTDISIGTDARQMWRFYKETVQQIYDLEKKRDLFCKTYLAEMRRSNIPFALNGEFLADLSERPLEDRENDGKRLAQIAMVVEFLFSPEFRKNHKVVFAGRTTGGYEGFYHVLKFDIGEYEYILQCPCPRKMPDKYFAGQTAPLEDLLYRADCIQIARANESVRKLDCLCFPTYDWKQCVDAIEKHVTAAENGGRVTLC